MVAKFPSFRMLQLSTEIQNGYMGGIAGVLAILK